MDKEFFQKQFKKLMIDENLNQSILAEKLGVARNSISKKMVNFSWRYVDLVNLLDELGYDVVWVKRDENNQQSK